MVFGSPIMLVLAAILPLVWLLSWIRHRVRSRVLLPTAPHLARLRRFRHGFWAATPKVLMALGFLLLVLATTRPLKGWERTKWRRNGIDIMMLLDLSNSMRVEDLSPNRLAVVKKAARSFVKGLEGDRIGLITMTEFPLYRVPLTTDYPALMHVIDNLRFDDQGKGGSALGDAILTAVNRLKDREGSSKIMVMVSDGAPEADMVNMFDAAKVAQRYGIRIYAIGIGTRQGGPVPFDDLLHGRQYLRDLNGNLRICKLEEEALERIARIGGGMYFSAQNLEELNRVFAEISGMERTQGWEEITYIWNERYALFLIPALAMLVLGPVVEVLKRGQGI